MILSNGNYRSILILAIIIIAPVMLHGQQFFLFSGIGPGQASNAYDKGDLTYTMELGIGFATKSNILEVSAGFRTEPLNLYPEWDLKVFSLPLSCTVYPGFNPKPFVGISLAPCYPTQKLVGRNVFLSGGISGGLICEFRRLASYAKFEYLKDLTGYSTFYFSNQEKKKMYLDRYYISFGVRVKI